MADKAITVANVRAYGTPTPIQVGESGIAPGMYLYADAADGGKLKMAKRNSTVAIATALYCAMSYASDDEYVLVQALSRSYAPGFTVAVGEIYVLGTGFGGVEAVSDLAGGAIGSGHFLCIIGYGISTGLIYPIFKSSTAAHA